MKLLIPLSPLLGLAIAQANFDDWHAPVAGDLRGPCPGLNALANHGFLPRDGKNLSIPTVVQGLSKINVSPEIATILATAAMNTSSDPSSGAFTLDDLKNHAKLEHDGSLSREDVDVVGNENPVLNETVYSEFLGYFNGVTDITPKLAAQARWGRIKTSRERNPKHTYNAVNRFNSYAETGVYFQTLMDAAKATVPLKYLKVLFEEERFPAKEGWRPVNSVNGFSMASIILRLALNTPEEAAEVSTMSGGSFHAALF